jgi:hypothetical protein
MTETAAPLKISSTRQYQTHLNINSVTADAISLGYNTMPNNQPAANGNFVAIWQNQNQVPWNQKPLATKPLGGNSQAGSLSFDNLDVTNNSYILGFAVGTDITNICATAYVPAQSEGGAQYPTTTTTLSLQNLGTTSITVQFDTPAGYQPKSNGNWMGVWRGETASYINPPDAAVAVGLDANFGTQGINGISIGRGLTYTVGYFMGGWNADPTKRKQTTLAASLTFTN